MVFAGKHSKVGVVLSIQSDVNRLRGLLAYAEKLVDRLMRLGPDEELMMHVRRRRMDAELTAMKDDLQMIQRAVEEIVPRIVP